jgi:CxxC-x17-CxxC domain-containing protein
MNDYKSGGRPKDRRSFSGRSFGGRDSRRMYDVVCDECGKDCQVPFKPSQDKPIYCSECFEKKGGRDRGRSGRRDFGRRDFKTRDSGRPSGVNINDQSIKQLTEKIETFNSKLDKIIDLLSPAEKKKSDTEKSKPTNKKKSKSKKTSKTAKTS